MNLTRLFSGDAYLKKMATAIADKHDVRVKFIGLGGGTTRADLSTKTVYLSSEDAWRYGDDFVVGNELHEIGHIQYTPQGSMAKVSAGKAHPASALQLHNLLEDERINAIIAKRYAGGAYYLDAFQSPALTEIARKLNGEALSITETDEAIKAATVSGRAFWTILATACLKVHKEYGHVPDLPIPAWRDCTEGLATLMRASVGKSAQEVIEMTDAAYKLMEPYAYKDNDELATTREVLKTMAGGYGASEDGDPQKEPERWERMDSEAQPLVNTLKRQLIARMRDNDHQRFTGNQRKGRLDKRSIHKVVRKGDRVHRKRIETKGKQYAASVILDCSGSMWNPHDGGSQVRRGIIYGTTPIDHGMRASALALRTLRSMGFPTSLTVYGTKPLEVLGHRAIYRPQNLIEHNIDSAYYHSGDNETHRAIEMQLPKLRSVGAGRHKIMLIITDGGLDSRDIERSHELLTDEMRRGDFTPVILYIGQNERILGDDTEHQANFTDINDLVPATVGLLKRITA